MMIRYKGKGLPGEGEPSKGAVGGTRTHILPLTRRVLFDLRGSFRFSYVRERGRQGYLPSPFLKRQSSFSLQQRAVKELIPALPSRSQGNGKSRSIERERRRQDNVDLAPTGEGFLG